MESSITISRVLPRLARASFMTIGILIACRSLAVYSRSYYQEHSRAREDPGYYLLPMILNSIFLRASPFSFSWSGTRSPQTTWGCSKCLTGLSLDRVAWRSSWLGWCKILTSVSSTMRHWRWPPMVALGIPVCQRHATRSGCDWALMCSCASNTQILRTAMHLLPGHTRWVITKDD